MSNGTHSAVIGLLIFAIAIIFAVVSWMARQEAERLKSQGPIGPNPEHWITKQLHMDTLKFLVIGSKIVRFVSLIIGLISLYIMFTAHIPVVH